MRTIIILPAVAPILEVTPPLRVKLEATGAAFPGPGPVVALYDRVRIERVRSGAGPAALLLDEDLTSGMNGSPNGIRMTVRSEPLSRAAGPHIPAFRVAASRAVGTVSGKATRLVHIKPECPPDTQLGDRQAAGLQLPPARIAPEADQGEDAP